MDTNGAASSGGIERASGNDEALQGLDGDREARTGGVDTGLWALCSDIEFSFSPALTVGKGLTLLQEYEVDDTLQSLGLESSNL